MRTFRSLVAGTLLLGASPSFAAATTATLYFVPWDVETRSDLSSGRLRESPWVRVEVSAHRAGDLFALLDGDGPVTPPASAAKDLRLVADFSERDGTTVTFVADRFRLVNLTTGHVRAVDPALRHRLATLLLDE